MGPLLRYVHVPWVGKSTISLAGLYRYMSAIYRLVNSIPVGTCCWKLGFLHLTPRKIYVERINHRIFGDSRDYF